MHSQSRRHLSMYALDSVRIWIRLRQIRHRIRAKTHTLSRIRLRNDYCQLKVGSSVPPPSGSLKPPPTSVLKLTLVEALESDMAKSTTPVDRKAENGFDQIGYGIPLSSLAPGEIARGLKSVWHRGTFEA